MLNKCDDKNYKQILSYWDITKTELKLKGIKVNEAVATDYHDVFFNIIQPMYSEPSRYYHTLKHILHCYDTFFNHRHFAKNQIAVSLAIWFHDIDSHSEENSFNIFRTVFDQASMERELFEQVRSNILATKHNKTDLQDDEALTADIDLIILGQPDTMFRFYEIEVRSEYRHVPEKLFKIFRTNILSSFLKKEKLYYTDYFRDKYEVQARRNLEQSIERLK